MPWQNKYHSINRNFEPAKNEEPLIFPNNGLYKISFSKSQEKNSGFASRPPSFSRQLSKFLPFGRTGQGSPEHCSLISNNYDDQPRIMTIEFDSDQSHGYFVADL